MNYAQSTSGKEFLEGIEKRESQLTISSLKISFNNVFGYIEVRNLHKDKVPAGGLESKP
jgi:DNA mismatch repair protein MutS